MRRIGKDWQIKMLRNHLNAIEKIISDHGSYSISLEYLEKQRTEVLKDLLARQIETFNRS